LSFLHLDSSFVSPARRFFQMNCPDVTSQSTTSLRAGRILDVHEKPIENLFAFIRCASNTGRWYLEVSHFVIAAKKQRDEGSFFERGGQPANFHAVDFIVPRFRGEQGKEEECSRAFVTQVWISGRPLSNFECLLYDEWDEKNSCCRDGPDRSIVGVNLCLVRRLFSRLFTPPRQCRRSRGARVRPTASARGVQAHTYIKRTCDLFAFLPGYVIEICRTISFVKRFYTDRKRKLWMNDFFGCSSVIDEVSWNSHCNIIENFSFIDDNNYLLHASSA